MSLLVDDRPRGGPDGARGPLEPLGSACHALAAAAAEQIRNAIGPDAVVALVLPDSAGRLRVVWREGERLDAGRAGSARRRAAFRTMRPARVHPVDGEVHTLAVLPLAGRGERVGVLEVVGSSRAMESAWEALEVTASELGIALRDLADRGQLNREAGVMDWAWTLRTDLVRARTPDVAVGIAVGCVSERFGVAVAGWSVGADGRLHLSSVHGLDSRKERELRRSMSQMPRWATMRPIEQGSLRRQFGEVVGLGRVAVLDVGDAVLLVGSPNRLLGTSLEVVGSLLGEVLRLLAITTLAEQRNQQFDMGIAWTAHELRGPLLGVRAVLEVLLQRTGADPRDRAIIRRSLGELDQLVGTAEALLEWAGEARSLHRRRTDVVRLVEEAVESCRLGSVDGEVVVSFDRPVVARIDAAHIRTAVANLVRNALAFAEPGTKVEVVVERTDNMAILSVKNVGQEIPFSERERIFAPFVRGSARARSGDGYGLGLFIARRMVEAHGGRIWVESQRGTVTFRVVFPVAQGEAHRSASIAEDPSVVRGDPPRRPSKASAWSWSA